MNRFWDELSHVGLPQDLNVQSLFETGKKLFSNFKKDCYNSLIQGFIL